MNKIKNEAVKNFRFLQPHFVGDDACIVPFLPISSK